MAKSGAQRAAGRIRNERILSLPRRKLKRAPSTPSTPNTILAESGDQLRAESGAYLRTEQ
jgi:hypothetical protein